ncbi:hypothetical protein D3C76_1586810 [compost metagenome]
MGLMFVAGAFVFCVFEGFGSAVFFGARVGVRFVFFILPGLLVARRTAASASGFLYNLKLVKKRFILPEGSS